MALDCGPERVVRTPGAREREESREVANVRVTNGFWGLVVVLFGVVVVVGVVVRGRGGGRCGSRARAEEEGKVRRPSSGIGVP